MHFTGGSPFYALAPCLNNKSLNSSDVTAFLHTVKGEHRHFCLRMLGSSICESLRSLAHSNWVNFSQAALRAMLKPWNISSWLQARQIPIRYPVCVYPSSTLPFIAVSSRFIHCFALITIFTHFGRCLNLFQSIKKKRRTGAKLVLSAAFFGIRYSWVALKGLLINVPKSIRAAG